MALDATSGRTFWTYRHTPSPIPNICCRGPVNRGLAILGDTLFMATINAHLVAVDAVNGRLRWKTKVAEAKENYAMTLAPLVVKDKVIVGVAGADFGIRGFIAAYERANGERSLAVLHHSRRPENQGTKRGSKGATPGSTGAGRPG